MSTRKRRKQRQRARDRAAASSASAQKGWSVKLQTDGWFQTGWSPRHTEDLTRFSAVFACINLIADDISKLTIRHYRRNADGTREERPRSRVVALLNRPNGFQTRIDLIKQLLVGRLWEGNGYLYGMPGDGPLPESLTVISPYRVIPYVAVDGSVFYDTSFLDLELPGIGKMTTFRVPARDMLHHRTLTFRHPLRGISPLHAAALSSSIGQTILERQDRFFSQNARPGGVLKTPNVLSKPVIERLKSQMNDAEEVRERTGGTLILEEGLEFQAMSSSAKDSELIETMNFAVGDVARAYKVPKYMLGELEGVNYNSTEQLRSIYYGNCLQSEIESLEARLGAFFGLPANEWLEFDLDQLLRAEMNVRIETLGKGTATGVFTPNEARKKEGLEPLEGGDNAFMQQQMRPIDQLAQPQPAAPVPAPNQAALYEAQLRSMLH